MATTSYIEFIEEKGFWIKNYFMETTLEYICQAIEKDMNKHPQWMKEQYEILDNNRLGFFPGMMDLAIDSYLTSQERKSYFIGTLEQAKEIIFDKGEEIPVKELKAYDDKKNEELRYRVMTSFKTTYISQILDELIKMINDGEDYDNSIHESSFQFQDTDIA